MILYISTEEKADLLNSVSEKYHLPISIIKEHKNLKRMIIQDISNFSHITYLVIDVEAIDGNDNIVEIINSFSTMYQAHIIIIAPKNGLKDYIEKLIKMGIYNIVTNTDPIGFDEKIKKCFENGMSKDDIDIEYYGYSTTRREVAIENIPIQNTKTSFIKPTCKNKKTILKRKTHKLSHPIMVAVGGVERKVGTTHQSLLIATFLHSMGYKVCYLEANNHKHIYTLNALYSIEKSENEPKFTYKGIDIYYGFVFSELMVKGYDFFVYDFGTIEEITEEIFLTKDIKIIIGGSKIWEISAYDNLKKLGNYRDLHFIINFADEGQGKVIKSFLKAFKNGVHFSDYAPSFFSENINSNIYKLIFKEYLEMVDCDGDYESAPIKKGVLSLFCKK